jgi:hypothetical protein
LIKEEEEEVEAEVVRMMCRSSDGEEGHVAMLNIPSVKVFCWFWSAPDIRIA